MSPTGNRVMPRPSSASFLSNRKLFTVTCGRSATSFLRPRTSKGHFAVDSSVPKASTSWSINSAGVFGVPFRLR